MTRHMRFGLFTVLALAATSVTAAVANGPDAPVVEAVQEGKTGITWEVQPAEVVIYLDEKRIGTAGDLKFTEAKPGKHTVKLMRGKDETEMEISVKKGQALKFIYQFED